MNSIIPAVVLIGTIISVYTDIKDKYVPNAVSYFLISFGLGANAIISLFLSSYKPLLFSIIGAVSLYIIGAALYYSGIWGGGDAKLLTGFGASFGSVASISAWPFLVTLLFNIVIFGSLFGLTVSLFMAVKHRHKFIKEIRRLFKKFRIVIYVLYGCLIIVILSILTKKLTLLISGVWSSAVVLFYAFLGLKAVENSCMYEYIKPSKLVEGDWIAEPIKVGNKTIYKPEKAGITEKNIKELKKTGKKVKIKQGIQYVPGFLAGLAASLLKIDILFIIFKYILY